MDRTVSEYRISAINELKAVQKKKIIETKTIKRTWLKAGI